MSGGLGVVEHPGAAVDDRDTVAAERRDRVVEHLGAAVDGFRVTGRGGLAALASLRLGFALEERGEPRRARRALEEGLGAAVTGPQGDTPYEVIPVGGADPAVLVRLAELRFAVGEVARGRAALAQALAAVRRGGADPALAERLAERVRIEEAEEGGDLSGALALARRAADATGDPRRRSGLLAKLCALALAAGDPGGAYAYASQGCELRDDLLAEHLRGRGTAAAALGRTAEAIGHLNESVRLARESGQAMPVRLVAALGALGAALAEDRRWADAQAVLAEGLALAAGPAWRGMRASLLAVRARTRFRQGDVDEAATLYREALALGEAAGDDATVATVCRELAPVQAAGGDRDGAVRLAGRALDIDRARGRQRAVVHELIALGRLGEDDRLAEALTLAQRIGFPEGQALALAELAALDLRAARFTAARDRATAAIDLLEANAHRLHEHRANRLLEGDARRSREGDGGGQGEGRADRVREGRTDRSFGGDARRSREGDAGGSREGRADRLLGGRARRLGEGDAGRQGEGRADRVWEGRTDRGLEGDAGAGRQGDADRVFGGGAHRVELAAAYAVRAAAREELGEVASALADAEHAADLGDPGPEVVEELRSRAVRLAVRLGRAATAWAHAERARQTLLGPEEDTARAVGGDAGRLVDLLPGGTGVVAFHAGDGFVSVVAHRDGWARPRVFGAPAGPELLADFAASARAGEGGRRRAELWRMVADLLLGEAVEALGADLDVLYLLPHGDLHGLPLHALAPGGRLLLDRYAVAYAPSAATLARLALRHTDHGRRSLATGQGEQAETVTAMRRPVVGKGEGGERGAAVRSPLVGQGQDGEGLAAVPSPVAGQGERGTGVRPPVTGQGEEAEGFAAMRPPMVKRDEGGERGAAVVGRGEGGKRGASGRSLVVGRGEEAAAVAAVMGVPLVGAAARDLEGSWDFVHLACPAWYDSADPYGSGLRLPGGLLNARALGDLRIEARLVSVAGCEPPPSGAGVAALGHALLRAGAAAALLPQWPVHPEAARELLPSFHAHLATGGAGEALRLSMLEARELYGSSRPELWAPYALIGLAT